MTIARAALDAQDLEAARAALAPLSRAIPACDARPCGSACLMAEIEEAAGLDGAAREWLEPRRARPARPRLGGGRLHQRPLVAGFPRPARSTPSSGARPTSV